MTKLIRPRTSYQWFYMTHYHDIALDNPSFKNKRIVKRIAKMWRELPEEDKIPYIEMYRQDIIRYEKQSDFYMKDWNYNNNNNNNKKNLRKKNNTCRDIWIFLSNILLIIIFLFLMRELFKNKTYALKTPSFHIPFPVYFNFNVFEKCSLNDYIPNLPNIPNLTYIVDNKKLDNVFYNYYVPSYDFLFYIP